MTLNLEKRLLTVDEYHRMEEVGILKPVDRVELLNGEIIKMSPFKSKHTSHVKRLNALMFKLVGELMTISVQDPITLNKYSEPEPDLALLKLSKNFYANKHPQAKDVILVVEVSDSTLEMDRTIKLDLYANAGIKEYWIVNLIDHQIEVYKKPVSGTYKLREIVHATDKIQLPKTKITVKASEILKK